MIDIFQYKKNPEENEYQFLWRLCNAKDLGLIEITWSDLAKILNEGIYGDEEDKYLGESAFRKKYQYAKAFNENVFMKSELPDRIRELTKERMKLQTEKADYNKTLRQEARDELILEKITESINKLPKIEFGNPIKENKTNKSYLLAFGDEHYGMEFRINGLNGEILNEYSPEIFQIRMSNMLSQVTDIVKKENINTLNIFSMGDFSDGILRVSQLMKLRYGVVDGVIKYAEYISNWLAVLSRYVRIIYQQTAGNHTELRLLGQQKGSFEDENIEKILAEFIKIRLFGNKNFEFVENPTGYNFAVLSGYNVLGIHGEQKMTDTIKNFSNIYGTKIDYLVAGHYHHNKSEEVGINKEVINVGSIVGMDPYALKLQKGTDPSAKLFVFEEGYGKIIDYTIKL